MEKTVLNANIKKNAYIIRISLLKQQSVTLILFQMLT